MFGQASCWPEQAALQVPALGISSVGGAHSGAPAQRTAAAGPGGRAASELQAGTTGKQASMIHHRHLFILFLFSHLADAFIQSDLHMCDLQCIHILHLH